MSSANLNEEPNPSPDPKRSWIDRLLPFEPARRRTALITISILSMLLVCGCCSCGLLVSLAIGDAVERVKGHRVIQQEIGDVRHVEADMEATQKLSQEDPSRHRVVLKAKGTDGEVEVIIEFTEKGTFLERMNTEDGRSIELDEMPTESTEDSSEQDAEAPEIPSDVI